MTDAEVERVPVGLRRSNWQGAARGGGREVFDVIASAVCSNAVVSSGHGWVAERDLA